jgi:hypothetical protein
MASPTSSGYQRNMQQHVIPYNMMDIEFKLLGFMTLYQFVYVAAGGVLGYITYAMVKNGVLPALIGYPLMIFLGTMGIAFGLVPYRGRALDKWLLSYIDAITSPTKRGWKKEGITPDAIPAAVPIDQLKPKQISLNRETTVSQIIGGLNIPSPKLSNANAPQKDVLPNQQKIKKVNMQQYAQQDDANQSGAQQTSQRGNVEEETVSKKGQFEDRRFESMKGSPKKPFGKTSIKKEENNVQRREQLNQTVDQSSQEESVKGPNYKGNEYKPESYDSDNVGEIKLTQ